MELVKSIGYFEQAIALDPTYATAYGQPAQVYFFMGLFGMGTPGELFPKARASAERALKLDDHVASAHNALAAVHILCDWNWAAAEAECKRALRN
jgi:tetratricopeptide (TPR) repeat protein